MKSHRSILQQRDRECESRPCAHWIQQKRKYVRHIQLLFNKIDSNDRGSLSAAEFAKVLVAEVLAGYFSVLDLDVKVVWALFRLLVADNVQRNRIYDREKKNNSGKIRFRSSGRSEK